MSKKLIGFFVVGILLNSAAFAQGAVKEALDFHSEMSKVSELCQEDNCEKPYSKEIIYHYLEKQNIDLGLRKIFERISHRQAQIWGDTILEGDYAAEGNTRLDKVTQLYKDNEPIGYMITYSEKAWDTANCLYDGINDSTLRDCIEGRIYESSYVSSSFREFFYDLKKMAVFK